MLAAAFATLALLVYSRGEDLLLASAPVLVTGIFYLFWWIPLRQSVWLVFFLTLTTERMGDSHDAYQSWLFPIGQVLNSKFSVLTNIKVLQFSGADVLYVFLLVVLLVRAGKRDPVDGPPELRVQTARPLGMFALLYAGMVLIEFGRGMTSGGDLSIALWQARSLIHLPFYFFIFQAGLRGPADFRAIGRAVVLAACLRALLVIYVRFTVFADVSLETLIYVTNHDDSTTFALAMVILLVGLNEEPTRRQISACVLCLPLIAAGVIVNHRRLAWVDFAAVMLVYFFMSPWTRIKRAVARGFVLSLPLLLVYIAAGWNSGSKVFGPVKMIKSVVSSDADRSTLDRDVENWNLASTMHGSRALGRGLGKQYDEVFPMDDISVAFPQYKSFPHNSVLGVWVFFGFLGFVALWSLFVTAIFLAARSYHRGATPQMRTAAIAGLGVLAIFLNQAYGDMAFWTDVGTILVAMGMAVVGKAAVATGAWPARVPQPDWMRGPSSLAPSENPPARGLQVSSELVLR